MYIEPQDILQNHNLLRLPKYVLITFLALSTTSRSSMVAGTSTSLSKFPSLASSTNCLSTLLSVLPLLVRGITPWAWITPPIVAIGPTAARTRELIEDKSSLSGIGSAEDERATKAKGTCPFKWSGLGMTHASVIDGCDEMACSSAAVSLSVSSSIASNYMKTYQY